MDLICMDKGRWKSAVTEVISQAGQQTHGELGLSQAERHEEIIRTRLLSILVGATAPHISAGTDAHREFADSIDATIEAVILNSQKDGLDLDGDLLDLLTHISGNLHAIQVKWKEIETLLTQPQ